MPSHFSVDAPIIGEGVGYALTQIALNGGDQPPDGLVPVSWFAPEVLKKAGEEIAWYFKREFQYDFVQYEADEGRRTKDAEARKDCVVLFTNDEPRPFTRAVGAACFRRRQTQDASWYWGLSCVWLHPFVRGNNRLANAWKYFADRFGRFFVEPPYSKSMHAFLKKYHPEFMNLPGPNDSRGDWLDFVDRLERDPVPEPYQFAPYASLEEVFENGYYDSLSEESKREIDDLSDLKESDDHLDGSEGSAFWGWLQEQTDRDDQIGDIAKDILARHAKNPYFPGLRSFWEDMVKWGITLAGLECLLKAWKEFRLGPDSVDATIRTKIQETMSNIQDTCRQVRLGVLPKQHPDTMAIQAVEKAARACRSAWGRHL